MWFLVIYVVMFFITLVALHKWKDKLGINSYDEPNSGWNDWDSNAQAYAAWSIGWPLIWIVMIVILLWKCIHLLSIKIGELIK